MQILGWLGELGELAGVAGLAGLAELAGLAGLAGCAGWAGWASCYAHFFLLCKFLAVMQNSVMQISSCYANSGLARGAG